MCIFSTLIIWEIGLQCSDLIWAINFVPPLSLSLHSSSPTFKLLSMTSYGGELVLDSSSLWSGVCNHHSSFAIPLPLIFEKQRSPLMKKIQGLQALHGAALCDIKLSHLVFVFQFPFLSLQFRSPLSLSLHSSSPTFKFLSLASYSGELALDSSSPWSGVSNHLSSFSISLSLIFKKQRNSLMKKIQGLQALHRATSVSF